MSMQFRALAIDRSAAEHRLLLDATDAAAARRACAKDGMTVLELSPLTGSASSWTSARLGKSRFDLDLFCQELLAMVKAGVTMREALQTLAVKESAGVGAVGLLLQRVEEGQPLSRAMAQQPATFPVLLTESMRAAEQTSDYAPALMRFVDYRRLGRELSAKLMAAALYPMILLGVSGLVLVFLVGYVVPRFAQVYQDLGDRLPAASKLLLAVGEALSSQPWVSAAVLTAFAVAIVAGWRAGWGRGALMVVGRAVPRLRQTLDVVEMARLYRTLALLLGGGLPLVAALDLASGVLPAATAQRLAAARRRISEGQPFSASLAAHGLTTVVADRFFRVGEHTGRLAEMIDRAAEFHEDEVARAADWVGRVIGPVLMLVMGIVIGFVVVLMYMPIFQLTEVLQ